MQRLELHPRNPQTRHIKSIAEALQKDGLVLYPTDSGYAIGCNAESSKAIHKLYALKKPMKKFFMALLIPDIKKANGYARISNFAFSVIKNRVPGPYTFILPADAGIARRLDVKRPEIGIRVPAHPFFDELFQHFDHPLLSTAAKLSEEQELTDPDELAKLFQNSVDIFADVGAVALAPTNIIRLVEDQIEVLRGEL
jgi:tRNA threonylcarbamoyl adenosine modification protein (Sua5/YciO/YrdC/YwlC family)